MPRKTSKGNKIIVRVTGQANQGGRKEMEDFTRVIFEREPQQALFAVFDGHGGRHAANFAREHLWRELKRQRGFYSGEVNHVVKAIKEGFMATHRAMWKQLDSWPRTRHGLPSTSGTTVTAVILKGKTLYIAHVGDSGAALGRVNKEGKLHAVPLTADHKPDVPSEKSRIESLGGSVLSRNGVPRVAWKRPVHLGHKGPVRRSTEMEAVPFLAVSRSLGDLWSFDYYRGEFIVSPVPDVQVHKIVSGDKFVVIATDGLWGVMRPDEAVKFVHNFDKDDEYTGGDVSHRLILRALSRWRERDLRPDNTSVIIVYFDEVKPNSNRGKCSHTEESEEETEINDEDDAAQDSITTPPQNTVPTEKPTLVRKLAFRCTSPERVTSCADQSSNPTNGGTFDRLQHT